MKGDDIISDDLSSILSGLSSDDISSLKQMAENLFENNPSIKSMLNDDSNSKKEEKKNDDDGGFSLDPAMMMKLGNIMSSFSQHDERSDFIRALKPHLSPERQKRADNAIQIMKILRILPSLGDLNIL